MRLALIIYLCFIASFAQAATEKAVISVYSYHLKPPLIVNDMEQKGLYFDVINHLNTSSSIYHFNLVYVPRKRIERMIAEGSFDGILLGVNPIWFKDKNETKYLWTPRIFTDRDEVVSLKQNSFEFITPASLTGKIFGGVRGFYYFGINEFISTQGALRVDTVREIDLFKMLLNKRIDTAVISRSTYDYMLSLNHWHDQFYLSQKPHDIYDRRILIPKEKQALYEHIKPIIEHLQFNKAWQQTIDSYK